MGFSVSGLASGLPVNDIISQLIAIERRPIDLLEIRKSEISLEKAQFSSIKNQANSLLSAMDKILDARLGTSFDLFEKKGATSSDEAKVTATASNTATSGSFTLDILQLATATRADSTSTVGQSTLGTSDISEVSEGAITEGDFTVYVNSQAFNITVTAGDTVQNVIDSVASVLPAGVASVEPDGSVHFDFTPGTTVQFGAGGDTSNFAQVMHLTTGTLDSPSGTFDGKFGTSVIDRSATLTDNSANLNTTVTAGTFSINGTEITIDGTSTLSSVIADINSDDTGVIATFNTTTNELELVSKDSGETAIALGAAGDTSNFLSAVNLVSGTDSLSSQTLGQNAEFQINGGPVLENSGNGGITDTVHGVTGVTLDLLDTTASSVTITVDTDTEELENAISDVVTKFNTMINFIDQQTDSEAGGVLAGESSLIRFRNELRSEVSDLVSGLSDYTTLSLVGISTGSVGSTSGTPSANLTFDADKFRAALADNPDEVKKLFIGNDTEGITGAFEVMETTLDGALDPEFGLFSSRETSANDLIKSIDDAIARAEERLISKEEQLRAQFNAMEQLISSFQQQQSAIAGFSSGLG